MSELSTVHVTGISPATSNKEVEDFFSFWYALPAPVEKRQLINHQWENHLNLSDPRVSRGEFSEIRFGDL